ncbi:Putative methyltransferase NSUN5 [Harpegnathos saltator]|uniref:Putative methyltransferase NSUN5 n=1 Tax=Harpegnathos saltator TaxID=610380 RepID=E2BZ46_HARSA|nr:Putative methyltransferase NSUN5 [Harpegnathos saltator]
MSNGFIHSVKVPKIYKITANIVRCVQEQGGSLKTLIYEKKHPNVSGIYALSVNTLKADHKLDLLLQNTQILTQQPRLDPWLTKVLITELLWGKKYLPNQSKPIQTVLSYADLLRKELLNLESTISSTTLKKVQRPRYVRINTLLLLIEQAISLFEREGWKLISKSATYPSYLQSLSLLSEPYFIQDFHIPEVLAFPPSTFFHDHASYLDGQIVLQDKASCLSAHLLAPTEGSTVLDLCAAPGMKSTHLAAKLQNVGTVHAIEIDSERFQTLQQQIDITHSFCVEPHNQDALTLNTKQFQNVRYILVDPSCSGSGIIDRPKQSDSDGKTEPRRLHNLQSIQVYLLRYALFNFPDVKRVVYSTCSVYPEENEQVVDEVLSNVGDAYHLVSMKDILKEKWLNFSSPAYNCGDKCLYSKPDVDLCNGFFVAVFERNFEVPLPKCNRKGGNVKVEQSNLDTEKDNITENDTEINKKVSEESKSYKRKKRRQKKNKLLDKQLEECVNKQMRKVSEDTDELEKTEEVKDENMDVCFDSGDREVRSTEEAILNKLEENSAQSTKSRKLKEKKKSKDDVFEAENDKNEIIIWDVEEMKQDEAVGTKLSKKSKRKKMKEDIEIIEIDKSKKKKKSKNNVIQEEDNTNEIKVYDVEVKQDEEAGTKLSKKSKRKKMKEDIEIIEIDKSKKKKKSKNNVIQEEDNTNEIKVYDPEEVKQDEEVGTKSSKKNKRKKMREDVEVLEVDNDVKRSNKNKQIEIEPVKKKRKKEANRNDNEIDNNGGKK